MRHHFNTLQQKAVQDSTVQYSTVLHSTLLMAQNKQLIKRSIIKLILVMNGLHHVQYTWYVPYLFENVHIVRTIFIWECTHSTCHIYLRMYTWHVPYLFENVHMARTIFIWEWNEVRVPMNVDQHFHDRKRNGPTDKKRRTNTKEDKNVWYRT